jgi:hypothetical protein
MDLLPGGANSEHPEWEISNAKGYWSLNVGVFYNEGGMRERKKASEEYVKILRGEGVEAYFHHGAERSSVCVGAFPKEAIQTMQRSNPLTGALTVTNRIVDARMLKLQEKYPHNLHNGAIFYELIWNPKTQKKEKEPHYSFAVQIPQPAVVAPRAAPKRP